MIQCPPPGEKLLGRTMAVDVHGYFLFVKDADCHSSDYIDGEKN